LALVALLARLEHLMQAAQAVLVTSSSMSIRDRRGGLT
jgi:hypothetical protein